MQMPNDSVNLPDPSPRKRRRVQQVQIESLSLEGDGVATVAGQNWWVSGALPGEAVMAQKRKRRASGVEAIATEILDAAPERVSAPCQHDAVCSGCALQHMSVDAQRMLKQNRLQAHLEEAGVMVGSWLPPLYAATEGYRGRARLGAKYVAAKQDCLLGFRERMHARLIADLQQCEVLDPAIGHQLLPLRRLLLGMHAKDQIPQLEVIVTGHQCAVVVRHLTDLDAHDQALLCDFAKAHNMIFYLQPDGLHSIHWLEGQARAQEDLYYHLAQHDLRIYFSPGDFTQAHFALNEKMVDQVVAQMALLPTDRVLDLFCGVGNFTLPMAKRCQQVVGVEGAAPQVLRARKNAEMNGVQNVRFVVADLMLPEGGVGHDAGDVDWLDQSFDKVLLDPPRLGALSVVGWLPRLQASKVIYVACSTQTLARDAAVLQAHGYAATAAGIIDMFPHTRHVESMVVFERKA